MKRELPWCVTGSPDLPGSQKESRLRALLKYKMPMFPLDSRERHSQLLGFESKCCQMGGKRIGPRHQVSLGIGLLLL